jgi:hypothetical protein
MADNLTTQSATPATVPASSVIATDDVSGVHFQKVKIDVGGDGASATLGNSNPLPVSDAGGSLTVDGSVTANAGTNLNTSALLTESDFDTKTGALTETAPTTDTASSGLNGRLQRIAQRITSLIALLPSSIGQKAKAASLAVTLASDQDALPITDNSGSLTVDGTVAVSGTVAVTQSGTWDEVGINDSGNSITVDAVSLPLPTGASTLAEQQSQTTHLATIAGDTTDIETAVELLDDAVATTGSAIPAKGLAAAGTDGTNARILKTDASGELQVDVLTMPTTTVQATNLDIRDIDAATDDITVHGDVGVLDQLDLTNTNPLAVAIVDGSGDQITSFGGGVQYTEGDTDASITGTAVMWEDGSNTLRAASAAKPLPVEIIAGGGTGGTSAADDADFTDGTTAGTPAMGVYEATPSTVTDGDLGVVGITEARRLKTSATIDAALPAGTNNIGDVDVLSSALPTGASTLAEQQSQTTHLATIAGDTTDIEAAVELIDDTVATLGTTTYTETTTKGLIVAAVRRDADTTLVDTTNEVGPLQMNAAGQLKVEAFSGETLPVSLASVPSHAVTNAGTFPVQVDGSALTALQVIDNPVLVDDAAFTPATSSVMMAGFQADEGSTDSVDEGDAGAARMTLDRKVIVTQQGHTQGGLTTFMASGSDGSSILVATAQAIKASAGQMYGYYAYNPESAVTFVHFYNTAAASVTVGTTNPLFTIAIPPGSAANLNIAQGIVFSNAGWSCAATTTAGGNTAPATGVSLVVWYM